MKIKKRQQKKSLAQILTEESKGLDEKDTFFNVLDYSIERQGKQWEKNIK